MAKKHGRRTKPPRVQITCPVGSNGDPPLTGSPNFAACGLSRGVRFVKGMLTRESDDAQFPGITVLQPTTLQYMPAGTHFWVIIFRLEDVHEEGDTYTLEVSDTAHTDVAADPQSGIVLDPPTDPLPLSVKKTRKGKKVTAGGVISVTSPTTGARVCPQFCTYGTTTGTGVMSAALTGAAGTSQVMMPPPNWTISISSNAAAGTTATLTVMQTDSSPFTVPNLTFQNCGLP